MVNRLADSQAREIFGSRLDLPAIPQVLVNLLGKPSSALIIRERLWRYLLRWSRLPRFRLCRRWLCPPLRSLRRPLWFCRALRTFPLGSRLPPFGWSLWRLVGHWQPPLVGASPTVETLRTAVPYACLAERESYSRPTSLDGHLRSSGRE
jgi:hypothetical protein